MINGNNSNEENPAMTSRRASEFSLEDD